MHGANAGYKSQDLLQPVGREHETFETQANAMPMRLLRAVRTAYACVEQNENSIEVRRVVCNTELF